ncbi:alpha/beta-hydrolase [Microthyrium microscopicum]|uniref:Alpha/beta-hydrolase n=1 Tax=Microthyrium microscopicum TaxID=703497 RepID=A0A6A6TWF7_9PEZI|nr:alpha/beta-hydrolase [Microthyrium microscopicum]
MRQSIIVSALIASVAAQKGGGSIVSPYRKDDSGGSGPHKASYKADPALAKHTIYSPKTPPAEPMPLIVWGEGACANQGTAFVNLLTEIASHGYVIIANGPPGTPGSPMGSGSTTASMLTQSIDWVAKGGDGGKYGKIDMTRIGAAGQSCGGIEALTVTMSDPRIKATGMFNSGSFSTNPNISKVKNPIAYFLGGTGDIAYKNGLAEYKTIPATTPAILFNKDGAGHGGTYGEIQGGLFGKAGVAFFEYVFRNDTKAKSAIFDKSSPLIAGGFEIQTKGWK